MTSASADAETVQVIPIAVSLLAEALKSVTQIHFVQSLVEAVQLANRLAMAQDIVLLSPACASMDMFINYVDRGNQFVAAVEAL